MISDNKFYRNEYAKRCFRNIADFDYIAARTLFRNHCFDQFLILSQQCLEKYLKGILLYNDVKNKKSTHSLIGLLDKCNRIKHISFNDRTKALINNLDGIDGVRYMTYSFSARRNYILELDHAVFYIRKQCQSDFKYVKGMNAMKIEDLKRFNRDGMVIFAGDLESINKNANNKYSKLRKNLIWKNFYFGKNIKQTINFQQGLWAKNTVIGGKEDKPIYDAVKEYVYLPPDFKKFFK